MSDLPMDEIVEYVFGRYPDDERIDDWGDMLDRIELAFEVDLGSDLLSPQIKAIKAAVRKAKREYV